jgi:thiamine pyrophosphate-dependent acetolactate synthase large subunit-like protein
MTVVERPQSGAANALWGSDPIADLLRALDIEFIALTPGASFRGLHDSLVNHLGNTRPELVLFVHEENAVAMAHGYTRVTGRPLAVALHSNVGLMHATMAIFNAWCDRIPILIIGAVGPVDSVKRRPWVDWIHTARDLGALVRGYTKWDDLPASLPAALEALVRAYQIAVTPPCGPVYVCLDAALQEQLVDGTAQLPPLERFRPPVAGDPPDDTVEKIAQALKAARHPVILMGRVSSSAEDWRRRVTLAERLNARVFTDLKTGASFPTQHPLHAFPPGLYISADAGPLIEQADVILSLDWIDLAGSLRQACRGQQPNATIIQCSVDQYSHNGWSMDYQALPPADISVLASPDRLVAKLLDMFGEGDGKRPPPAMRAVAAEKSETDKSSDTKSADAKSSGAIAIMDLAKHCVEELVPYNPSYIRLPLGWPGEWARFASPLDYIGFDGGGGIGSGPGMAVGAALGLQKSDRLPVAILGDGDYLMGVTALWTAVNKRIPLLVIVANNHSFFNDELHQDRMARMRNRPVENRWIGLRMNDPVFDLAMLARGQGAAGIGPVKTTTDLIAALRDGAEQVRNGATCVIDVHVKPEYSRAMSSTLLRTIPG